MHDMKLSTPNSPSPILKFQHNKSNNNLYMEAPQQHNYNNEKLNYSIK